MWGVFPVPPTEILPTEITGISNDFEGINPKSKNKFLKKVIKP